ncbi:related to ribosomal protein [Phialocephala subalpina]|uniref:Large ribosomal subunit protein uL23m n=1 Tax=Phialocephala subalpina TaxID=576137 RepID=A0A1L7XI00_9HELO|nr:related to ribosomal protein [Phialocephala subalpina]
MASQIPARIGPKLGRKQIFLPNFTLTLLRTPNNPPTFASFIVPLNLNKLDLRDYLWNVYGVEVRGVRSYIQQQKVRQDKPGEKRPKPRKWFRPRAIKKMMVEMEKPFVWPAVPEKFDDWDKDTYDSAKKEREEAEQIFAHDYRQQPTKERASMAEQAKALLSGKDPWKTTPERERDEWEDDGEAVEVEQDIEVPPVKR